MADTVMVMLELGAIGVLGSRAWGATFGFRSGQVSVVSLVAVLALAVGGSTLAIAGLASDTEGHHAEASEPVGSQGDAEQKRAGEQAGAGGHGDHQPHAHEEGEPH